MPFGIPWGRKKTQLDRIEDNGVTLAQNQVALGRKLDVLITKSDKGDLVMGHLQADIDAMKAEVRETKDVVDSANVLMERLFQAVENHGDDSDELKATLAELRAAKSELASGVAKNTPVDPNPDPEPPQENRSRR